MAYQYVVLGAGIQGTTIAYDIAKYGEAAEVRLLDLDIERAQSSAAHVNQLLNQDTVKAGRVDVSSEADLMQALKGADACISAVTYLFNPLIARCAVASGVNFNDLGGNTDLVFEELKLHEQALAAGVSVIPDCGVAPGLCNTLAAHGIQQLDHCDEVKMRVGGLPQNPRPPLDYMLVFSMAGLTNEYFGKAVFLRDGKRIEVDTFDELEHLELPEPLGECEAFTTSGATSTAPWTYEGQIKNYDYKTIRYKGHYDKFKVMKDLGLLELEPVEVKGQQVVPRDLFHAVVEPRIHFPEDKDLLVLRVSCSGLKGGQPKTYQYTMLEYEDEATGLNAMSRMTGFPAAIVTIMMAQGLTEKGAVPLEKSVPTGPFLDALKMRGLKLDIQEF